MWSPWSYIAGASAFASSAHFHPRRFPSRAHTTNAIGTAGTKSFSKLGNANHSPTSSGFESFVITNNKDKLKTPMTTELVIPFSSAFGRPSQFAIVL